MCVCKIAIACFLGEEMSWLDSYWTDCCAVVGEWKKLEKMPNITVFVIAEMGKCEFYHNRFVV